MDKITRAIILTQGKATILDHEDFMRFKDFKWSARWDKKLKSFYAKRSVYLGGGRKNTIQTTRILHRDILGVTDPNIKVDHINHDTLDNRRKNLRLSTSVQNGMNRKGANSNSKSGVRGVHWDGRINKWVATISVEGRKLNIGSFVKKEDATYARVESNKRHFGAFQGEI